MAKKGRKKKDWPFWISYRKRNGAN